MRVRASERHCGDPQIGRPVPEERNVEKQLGSLKKARGVSGRRSDVGAASERMV